MNNFDDVTNENKVKYNAKQQYISDHLYRISGSGKTNALIKSINNQLDIVKTYLYIKD